MKLGYTGPVARKKGQEMCSQYLKKSVVKRLLEDQEVMGMTLKWVLTKML